MKIENLQTNHLYYPVGYCLENLTLSWEVTETEAKRAEWTQVIIALSEEFREEEIVYSSQAIYQYAENHIRPNISLIPYTRYYWKVHVETDKGEKAESAVAFFETAKREMSWQAEFIGVEEQTEAMPLLYKEFDIDKPVKRARAYICGLGLYECYINEEHLGEEYLLPGYHSYDLLLQYQTFTLDKNIKPGRNRIALLLGEGWYKGRFVFDGGYENLYGDSKKVIAELHIQYADGSKEIIVTDDSFQAEESHVFHNNMYDGEFIDDTFAGSPLTIKVFRGDKDKDKLQERRNPPIRKTEEKKAVQVLHTITGETILDFGEMLTGWVEFTSHLKKGEKSKLSYSEIMQQGNFYRENLRTAKAEFIYISDGTDKVIRPHFTYYGFRFVLVEGIEEVKIQDFTAFRIMSDMRQTGFIETSDAQINQLYENALRSQKCNFLDIPTDCPQRDERMGWTGDTAVFAQTACMNMDCAAFYKHYLHNLQKEQERLNGAVPFFVPLPKPAIHEGINPFLVKQGACTWGDVATILPWALYEQFGDINILKESYPIMKAWVAYVNDRTRENAIPWLWQNDAQLGDWLALDNGDLHNPIGKTDTGLIASAYFYHSADLCAKTAKLLAIEEDTIIYEDMAEHIRDALVGYYVDEDGKLKVPETQTAYCLLLAFGLYRNVTQKKYGARRLYLLLEENNFHLNTGFVGTPLLCEVLSENGYQETAYRLVLNEEYPGWLYAVRLGATTIWERWNSVNQDGCISGTEMNSLNHYAYGSIVNWMYKYMCGFRLVSEDMIHIAPQPDHRIEWVKADICHRGSSYKLGWKWLSEDKLQINITVPFNEEALIQLPDGKEVRASAGQHSFLCIDSNKKIGSF